MEVVTTPNYPWDDMHHHVYFHPKQTHDRYGVDSKEFIHGEVKWFNNPLLQTHELELHPPCVPYITTQWLSNGGIHL